MRRVKIAALVFAFAACVPHRSPRVASPEDASARATAQAIAARLAADPDDVEARLALAETRRVAGDAEGALVEAWKALASDPKSEAAQIERARIYFDRGLLSKEIEAWRAALDLVPADADARENLGHALLAAGRSADAAVEYRLALDGRPDSKAALYNLAQLETDAGRREVARSLWTRYLQIDAAGPWADKARAALATLEAHP